MSRKKFLTFPKLQNESWTFLKFRKSSRRLRGWIDLEKVHIKIAGFCMLIIGIGSVFGAFMYDPETSPAGARKGHNTQYFFSSQPASDPYSGGDLKLTKEYLYADTGLFAVEDSHATSSPPADLAIWRPSTGQWWTMRGEHTSQVTVQWGISTDVPAIGDYDGDGKTDFCVFRPSEGLWYLLKSSSGDSSTSVISFGAEGDIPAQADFDGDGLTDMAVWRPSSGIWFVQKSSDGSITQLPLGSSGDIPSPNDFDGDGMADPTVWREADTTFYSINSTNGTLKYTSMGMPGEPVSADFDGDGKSDHAVRNGALWKIRNSSSGSFKTEIWQNDEAVSVQNDYDGDGRVDIATWSPADGFWHILRSTDGQTRVEQWGINGDVPLPGLYRR